MSARKTCSNCRMSLPLESFGKRAASRDGLQYVCLECNRVVVARSRSRRPDTHLTYNRAHTKASEAIIRENRDRFEELLAYHLKRERAIAAIVGVRDVAS